MADTGHGPAGTTRVLPGDEMLAGRVVVMDRVATFAAQSGEVWPWLVQLGKGRAGWYLPSWAEVAVPVNRRGLRRIDPRLQRLRVGERVPDWGPGEPEFEVATVAAPHALVYRSLRRRSRDHAWPAVEEPLGPDTLALTWALVLDDLPDGGCRLHVRLRLRPTSGRGAVLMRTLGSAVDYVTVQLLFAGLRQRLATPPGAPRG